MGLLIKQGKHKDEKPLVSSYETGQVTGIKEVRDKDKNIVEGIMQVEFTIITPGAFQNKKVWDRVPYDPEDSMAWKYKNLRRHAGVPYDKSEPVEIDIEALLMNKAVGMELSIYEHKDGRLFQNISYKAVEPNASSGAEVTGGGTAIGEKPQLNAEEIADLEDLDAPTAKPVSPTEDAEPAKDLPASAIDIAEDDFPF